MSSRRFHRSDNMGTQTQSLLPPLGYKRFYGAYAQARARETAESVTARAWRSSSKQRNKPITLATAPFDFRKDAQ
jgi:hypothetical protein